MLAIDQLLKGPSLGQTYHVPVRVRVSFGRFVTVAVRTGVLVGQERSIDDGLIVYLLNDGEHIFRASIDELNTLSTEVLCM